MDGYQPYHGLGYDESMLSAAGLYSGLAAPRPSSYDLDHHHHLMPFSDPWYFAGDGSGPAAAPHGFAPRPQPDTYDRPRDGWRDEEPDDEEEEEAMMAEDREAAPAPEDDGAFCGSRLLSFLPPARRASILDKAGRASDVGVRAELSGMFFVAEDAILPSSSSAAGSGRKSPPLTCYRRNLWQVSGRVTLPQQGSDLLLLDQHGRRMPILGFAVSLHATESIDGRPVQIISIPWRGEVGGGGGGGAGVGDGSTGPRAPQDIALHLDHYHPDQAAAAALYGAGSKPVSFPISWNRLQFKQATANNGRRKGMQQHYFVLITLLARTAAGPRGCLWIPVVEARSGPVIVRGRSPRNFDSEREVAVTGLSDGQGGGGQAGAERRIDMRASSSASASPKSTRVSQEGDAAASKPERSGSAAAARLSPQPPPRHPENSSTNCPEKGRSSSPVQRHGRSHKRVILARSSSRRSQSQSQRPSAGYPDALALPRPRGRRGKDDDDDLGADYDYGDHSSGYEDYFAGGPDWVASADAVHGVEVARAAAEDAPISAATSASGSVRGGAKRRYAE